LYKSFIKRIFDFLVSLVGLIAISPLFIILFAWLYYANRGSGVFFTQERPGKNAKPFNVIKFKTMTEERDDEGRLLSDNNRLTGVGKMLRSTSMDELPQLFNVLNGDMSLIGPRPLVFQYVPLYTKEQARRHEVRPGITGWAQVNGRNDISWKNKFELDVWYVDHCFFTVDVKILIMTMIKIFKKEGIYRNGDINSMEAFNGQN
jgi:undecaprenyl phosphate N,N'-diacetylbacillosamine 1-phosphate transferase